MPKRNQIFTKGGYYHIFNRGHNKKPIFLHYKDYNRYLKRLKEYLDKHQVTLLAYCLMPNHLHLLIRQDQDESVERFIHRLHTAYTKYFNIKYERIGSVFQGRFKAKLIETDEYLLHVSRYIHLNPLELLRAQRPALNSQLSDYSWSSYNEYTGSPSLKLCNLEFILDYFSGKSSEVRKLKYKKFIEEWVDNADITFLENMNEGEIPSII